MHYGHIFHSKQKMLFRFQFLIIEIHSKVYTNQFKTKQILPKTSQNKINHISENLKCLFVNLKSPFLPCSTGAGGPSLDLLVMSYTNLELQTFNLIIVETDNALANVERLGPKRMLKLMKPPLPSDAALAIIEAGATKKKRLYYPYAEGRFIPILFCFFPDAMSKLFRYVWELKE